jgi:hypothetical protein
MELEKPSVFMLNVVLWLNTLINTWKRQSLKVLNNGIINQTDLTFQTLTHQKQTKLNKKKNSKKNHLYGKKTISNLTNVQTKIA